MSAINPRVLRDLRALPGPGGAGAVVELIDLFLKETEGRLRELRACAEVRNAAGLEQSARALKGICGNVGAQAMSRICADLERLGRPPDWARAAALLSALDTEVPAVKAELDVERRTS
jgi:HPt (histidine-containing phosphotransfer) domain-containing protein